jgi:hypothetical protein
MDLSRRLFAPVAIQRRDNRVVSVDLGAFLHRLLLFDTYILQSIWLDDLHLLSQTFAPEGLADLLQAGALKIHCHSYTVGQTGQARADLKFADNSQRLPLGSYSFSVLVAHEQEKKIQAALAGFTPALREELAANRILMPPEFSSRVFDGFYGDIRQGPRVLESAVKLELRKQGIKPKGVRLQIEEVAPEDFRVESNLEDTYGLSPETAHRILERSLLALVDLNKRFAEMTTYSALSGIREDDRPLLQGKLAVVADLVGSSNRETEFNRVVTLTGVPVPSFGSVRIDAQKLLKARESDECRAFRDWLRASDSLSDEQIDDRLKGLKSRISEFLNSTVGKAVRFVVSNGLSLGNPAIALAASAVDSFIVERLAPKDGVVSFLSETYPSLFRSSRGG